MIFIVYSLNNASSIGGSIGLGEYSYYFVLKAFMPLLESMGEVIVVDQVGPEVDKIYLKSLLRGKNCVFLSFSAPHNTNYSLRCPTLPIFAWEFPDIPSEQWGENPADDWTYVLDKLGAAITHSSYAVRSTKDAMGEGFPVACVPAPLWEEYTKLQSTRSERNGGERFVLNANVFDSYQIDQQQLVRSNCVIDSSRFINDCDVELALSGVVYTSVFNPNDGRKNWEDMLSGFCYAFRDQPDATLLLKLTYHDAKEAYSEVLKEVGRLMPFHCRIVIIHGYIDDVTYKKMIARTDYVVNTAYGEGQCMPLMEGMSAGKPAVAPCHSAMLDYVTDENAFVVESSSEWTFWPHDPRIVNRTFRSRISWQSLRDQYLASFEVATSDSARYEKMSLQAVESLREYCSLEGGRKALSSIISKLPFQHSHTKRFALVLFDNTVSILRAIKRKLISRNKLLS